MPDSSGGRTSPASRTSGRRVPARGACLVAALCLLLPISPAEAQTGATSDTLRVAVLEHWPPHYVTGADGRPGGFAVDVMEAVARLAGLAVVYAPVVGFPEAIEALENGEVDVIPDFGIIDERTETFAFTRPFDAFSLVVFARRSDAELGRGGDLGDARIAVVDLNAAASILSARSPEVTLVPFSDVGSALFELLAAGVDGVAYPEEVFLELARSAGVEDRVRVLDPPLAEIPRGMGVRRGDTELLARLDVALEALVASDEYETLYRRWFAEAQPFWTVPRVLWGAAGALLVALLAMGAWRYQSVSRLARDLGAGLEERDAAVAAHDETHRVLRRTLACLDGAVFVIDSASRTVTACNEAAEAIFGYDRDELIGNDTRMLHVDERAFQAFASVGDPVLHEGRTFQGAFRMRRKDGSTFPTRNTVSLLDPEHGFEGGVVSIVYDVTDEVQAQHDLMESEERFRQLAERISDVFWIRSPGKGRMEYVSPAYNEIWGSSPDALYRDATAWLDAVHPDDRPAVREALSDQVRGESSVEYRVVRPDGEVRWISDRAFPVHDAEGEVIRVVGVARDVTEQRRAEQERELLERQLRQAQRLEAVGRLAGGIAHDFNNLLTVIRSQTDLILLDLPRSSPLVEELEVVQSAADRAAKVTSQLLAFSRDQVLRPRTLDLDGVVRDIAVLLDRLIGEDVRMVLELDDALPPVQVDAGQLEQAVMNLGVNARDAMPGGGHLTLRTYLAAPGGWNGEPSDGDTGRDGVNEAATAPGSQVVLEVSDDGTGMDAETRLRIFEPFFTTKVRGTGTGLGLAMVYGFVKQSGGLVHVESELGKGTRFLLYFPVAGAIVEPEPETVRVPRRRRTGRVLLVEDDDSVRRVATRILEHAGLEVEAFEDAEQVLEVLMQGRYADVLLTDLGLPGMGGRALVDRVRELRPDLIVMVMSGYAVGSPGSMTDLPADVVFVQKPFTSDDLVESVRAALGEA
jgi:two-component system, cell cycle sensor histidine kinase and response regulator CckA